MVMDESFCKWSLPLVKKNSLDIRWCDALVTSKTYQNIQRIRAWRENKNRGGAAIGIIVATDQVKG